MNFLSKQMGIEQAQADQYAKDHKARSQEWGGPYCIKQRIVAAINEGKTSIVAAMVNYQEPDLEAIEEEILIEYGYGSEEFEMNFRIPPCRLAEFEITLRYPKRKRNPITPQNPRGAGRKSTGAVQRVKITGLSDDLDKWIESQPNKSLFLRSMLQDAFDRQSQNTP